MGTLGSLRSFTVLKGEAAWRTRLWLPLCVWGAVVGTDPEPCKRTAFAYFLILDKGLFRMRARGFITPPWKCLQSLRLLVQSIGPYVGAAVRCSLLSSCWRVAVAERAEAWPTASCCTVRRCRRSMPSPLQSADWTCHCAAIILCDWKAHRTLCTEQTAQD